MGDEQRGAPDGAVTLAEETLRVEKRSVSTGRVSVRTETQTEEVLVEEDLAGLKVEVTRVPIDREVETAPEVLQDGDLTVVPVVEEVLVVEKRLFLKEEVHIRRVSTTRRVEVPIALRKQTAHVEQDAANEPPMRKETEE